MSTKSKLALLSATLVVLFSTSAFAQTQAVAGHQQPGRLPLGSRGSWLRHRHCRTRWHPRPGARHGRRSRRHLEEPGSCREDSDADDSRSRADRIARPLRVRRRVPSPRPHQVLRITRARAVRTTHAVGASPRAIRTRT